MAIALDLRLHVVGYDVRKEEGGNLKDSVGDGKVRGVESTEKET